MRPTGEAMLDAVRRAVATSGVALGTDDVRARIRLEAEIDREVRGISEVIGVCEDCGGLCDQEPE